MSDDLATIEVRVLQTTDRAVLVTDTDDDEAGVWLWLSQIEMSPVGKGDIATIVLPQRLAEERRLV